MTRILAPIPVLPHRGRCSSPLVGAVWYVMDLRADKAALGAENAALAGSVAALETTLDAERHGQKLAWAAAVQNAADARSRPNGAGRLPQRR